MKFKLIALMRRYDMTNFLEKKELHWYPHIAMRLGYWRGEKVSRVRRVEKLAEEESSGHRFVLRCGKVDIGTL